MFFVMITDGRFVGRGECGDDGLGLDAEDKWRWCGDEEGNEAVVDDGGGGGGGTGTEAGGDDDE